MTLEEKIMFIEQNMGEDCEFLLRTNHDPDKCSGQPADTGKWMVDLMRTKGDRYEGNVSVKTVYLKYGDDLNDLLDGTVKCIKNEKIEEYKFHIGDYVETVDGLVGVIEDICDCSECKEIGFLEPRIKYVDGSAGFITKNQIDHMDKLYKRVGKYVFNSGNNKPKDLGEVKEFIFKELVNKYGEAVLSKRPGRNQIVIDTQTKYYGHSDVWLDFCYFH